LIVGPDQKDDRSEPVKKATSITSQTSQQEKGAAPLERKRTSRATVRRVRSIQEDPLLEALCERTDMEAQTTVRHKRVSVSNRERKRILAEMAYNPDTEEIFTDRDKMSAFIAESTGKSEYDQKINNDISQMSLHRRTSYCSLGEPVKRISIGPISGHQSTAPMKRQSLTSQVTKGSDVTQPSQIESKSSKINGSKLSAKLSQASSVQGVPAPRRTMSSNSVLRMIETTREKSKREASRRRASRMKVDSKIKMMNSENQTLDFDDDTQYMTPGRMTTGTIIIDPLREATDENLTNYITKSFTGIFNKSGSNASLKPKENNRLSNLFKWK